MPHAATRVKRLYCVVAVGLSLGVPTHALAQAPRAGRPENPAVARAATSPGQILAREPVEGSPAQSADAQLAEGRDQFVRREIAPALAAFQQAVERAGGKGAAADAARCWMAICLLAQPTPASEKQTAEVLRGWPEGGRLEPGTWNLALRLVMRHTEAADPDRKAEAWRAGLALLRPSGDEVRLTPESLADLDHFLALDEQARGATSADAIADLILLTPGTRSIADLYSRLIPPAAGDTAGAGAARAAAWVELALRIPAADEGEFLAAVRGYERAAGVPAKPLASLPSAPKGAAFDPRLAARARGALDARAGLGSARRRAWLNLFAGQSDEAVRLAYAAALSAGPADAGARCDDLAAVAALAAGDLAAAAAAEAALFRRLAAAKGRAIDAADRWSAAIDAALRDVTTAAKTNGDDSATGGGATGGGLPLYRLTASPAARVARGRRAEWAARGTARARAALAGGADDVAVVAWLMAAAAPEAPDGGHLVEMAELDLRWLGDVRRAAAVAGMLAPLVPDATSARRAALLHARLLYESGQMQPALDALATAERTQSPDADTGAGDRDRLPAGLIRAVALIKLGRTDEALKHLESLDGQAGDDDSLAQRAFLRGWIHLSRNEMVDALVFLRQVVDEHGGSGYAANSRELIRRLEPAGAAPADRGPGGR